ncbi:response regulator [Phaeobacter sp.]|uniref:response regulator n=1 Tax=Phaeobacter sp. TaxID=1902409 RepID=UPI0025D84736|nr:response regulator [Phaeobacter sp.]
MCCLDEEIANHSRMISSAPKISLGGKALVVEDSLIIAMDVSAMLEDLGFFAVSRASSIKSALTQLQTDTFEYAVLDVNLGAEQSLEVAKVLAELGIPFVLTTGYGASPDVIDAYPPCPVIQKPISEEKLAEALTQSAELIKGN